MKITHTIPALLACIPALGHGAISEYTVFTTYYIPSVSEASAVAYNRDTDTLFTIGDEGEKMVQISKTGTYIDAMNFEGGSRFDRAVDDPEGLTYLGGGKFMIADERDNMGRITTYVAGATRTTAELSTTSYAFGPNTVSNSELEGVAYDPLTGSVWGVKELGPTRVYNMTGIPELTGSAGSAVSVTQPLDGRPLNRIMANYGITSLSDIYVMAASLAYAGSQNLLLLARDQNLVIETDRAGNVIGTLDISSFGRGTIEGMTMDDEGNLYLVSEENPLAATPEGRMSGLHVISKVPEPSSMMLGLAGAALLVRRRR